MKNDKEYGSGQEIEIFSNKFQIKNIEFTRYINNESCRKKPTDKLVPIIIGESYEGAFAIILDNYTKNNIKNHFQTLRPKNCNIDISDEKLKNIQNEIINLYPILILKK